MSLFSWNCPLFPSRNLYSEGIFKFLQKFRISNSIIFTAEKNSETLMMIERG